MMRHVRPSFFVTSLRHITSRIIVLLQQFASQASYHRLPSIVSPGAPLLRHTIRQLSSWARTIHAFSLTASSPYLAPSIQTFIIFASTSSLFFRPFLASFPLVLTQLSSQGQRTLLFFSRLGYRHIGIRYGTARAWAHGHGHGHNGATIKTDSEPLARAHITFTIPVSFWGFPGGFFYLIT